MLFFNGAATLNWQCVTGRGGEGGQRMYVEFMWFLIPNHVMFMAPAVQQQSFGPKDSFESSDSNGQHAWQKAKVALYCAAFPEQADDLVRQVFHMNTLDEWVKARSFTSLFATYDMFRVNVMCLAPIANHEDSSFEKTFSSQQTGQVACFMWIIWENSSVDLGLLHFP